MIGPSPPFWLFVVLAAPAGAAVLSLIPSSRVSEAVARGGSLVALAAAIALLVDGASGLWGPYLGLDALSDVFLVMVTGIYATSTFYSARYLRGIERPYLTPQIYYGLLSAFAFAMIAVLVVSDLGLMWIGIEATTVASALLVVLERRPTSVEAAWRYTLVASAGLTIALFALLLLYTDTGTLNAFTLAAQKPAVTLPVEMAVSLALVGYGTKVGLFPMHTWLPDAHSEAPSPVSAMFSGVLLPTALYAFLRVYAILPVPAPAPIADLVLAFGLLSAIVGAFLLQRQRSFKRMLAYSSMEVMGIAVVGVGVGGIALYGALVLLFAHAFAKSSAFYCSGNVLQTTGTTRIDEVRDLKTRVPWTGGAWILAALAVTGAPPFGTFVGELVIITGAVGLGEYWIAAVLVGVILVAFLGVNGQIGLMVFGEPRVPTVRSEPGGERGVGIAYLNLVVALLVGVAALPYLSSALRAAAQLLGGQLP
ncbi:MAG TPA: proton-conducting transporter membrane subunit [Thermoplasmata archaeon]|nr:proton-conducting transporter membrane subunit [Thermoplasmata archaeon]